VYECIIDCCCCCVCSFIRESLRSTGSVWRMMPDLWPGAAGALLSFRLFLFFSHPRCVSVALVTRSARSSRTLFVISLAPIFLSSFGWAGLFVREEQRETTLQHYVLLPRHYWLYTALLNISKCSSKNTTSFNSSFSFFSLPAVCCFPVQSRWDADLRHANFRVAFNRNSCGGPLSRQGRRRPLIFGGRPGILSSNGRTHRKCTRGCRQ
jgi:hypothetical protein